MDDGGNERQQLFRLDGDGETVTPLTAMPDAKHRWGGWSSDGTVRVRLEPARQRRLRRVRAGPTGTGDDAEMVYEGDGWLSSPDGVPTTTASWWSNRTPRSTGTSTSSTSNRATSEHVTPHEGNVRYQGINWGPDGDALYLVTDDGADTMYLARLDLDTYDIELVEEGGSWNVDGCALDEETGATRLLAQRGRLHGTHRRRVDRRDDHREFPDAQPAARNRGRRQFRPDAERFAISVTGSASNTNVYVVETETGEAERWTDASTAGLPTDSFVRPKLVHFESFDGRSIPAFFSVPDGATAGETPVIVDIHGGPESQRRPSFGAVKQYFLNRGYAYFEPNVRGSSGYGKEYTHLDDVEKRMDSVADVEAGVEWLHDHRVVDPDRIVAYGRFLRRFHGPRRR